MAGKTSIEWTRGADGSDGMTWNPVAGCTVLTPGCTNCYAMKMAARLSAMGQPLYEGLTKSSNAGAVWTGVMRQAPDATLLAPLKRKRPTTYFVNSMSDLFHENVPDDWIDKVFAVMALSPQHTFQVLTKRAARMRNYFANSDTHARIAALAMKLTPVGLDIKSVGLIWAPRQMPNNYFAIWPLPHVWLGVSTERQQEADERIPQLVETPAAVRFISAEPLLGPFDLIGTLARYQDRPNKRCAVPLGRQLIDWVITGGESGHRARPTNPQWFRDIRDQCQSAGIAFFHKQNGAWVSVSEVEGDGEHFHFPDGRTVRRVGKAKAGRLLDGVEHNGMPRAAA